MAATIDVWTIPLVDAAERMEQSWALLSDDERRRAERFGTEILRARYALGRATLRRILASYADVAPEAIRFAYNRNGKPRVAAPVTTIGFNLSHTSDLAVCAVCAEGEVGVDVERADRELAFEAIARRQFGARDQALLARTPPAERRRAFLRLWTRREALLKARGLGVFRLEQGLDVCDEIIGSWSLIELDAGAAHLATVACASPSPSIRPRALGTLRTLTRD